MSGVGHDNQAASKLYENFEQGELQNIAADLLIGIAQLAVEARRRGALFFEAELLRLGDLTRTEAEALARG